MEDESAGIAALRRGLADFSLAQYSTQMLLPPEFTDPALRDALRHAAQRAAAVKTTRKRHFVRIFEDLAIALSSGYAFGRSLIGTADVVGLYSGTEDAVYENSAVLLTAYGEFESGSQVVKEALTADAEEVILVTATNGIRKGTAHSKRVLGSEGAIQLCRDGMVEGMVFALLEAELFLPPPVPPNT